MTDITEPRHEPVEESQPLSFTTNPDGFPLTAEFARVMIKMVRRIRPAWSSKALAEALDQVREQDPNTTYLALIAAARNPAVTNPATITHHGVWWEAAETFPPRPEPAVVVQPMMSRRERKEGGFTSKLDDPAFKAAREAARAKKDKVARERGGHLITEDNMR